MHTYIDVDSFPGSISEITDVDPPNATNFNAATEGLANRTRWLRNRVPTLAYHANHIVTGPAVQFSTATLSAPDPAGRHPGNVGFKVASLTAGLPAMGANDWLEVSYAFDWFLTSGLTSDIVPAVWLDDGLGGVFISETICLSGCITGAFNQGAVWHAPTGAALQPTISRSGTYAPGAAITPAGIHLVAAFDTLNNGSYLQGCAITARIWHVGI